MHGAELLTRYLKKTKQTARALSRKAGISESELGRYMSRERRPGLAYALRIEEVTGRAVPAWSWLSVNVR